MIDYQLEHLFTYTATLQASPEVIGPVPDGIRINFYITGGHFSGPNLRGRMRPVGADWFVLKRDGCGTLDVRGTFETDDGALIYLTYSGVGDLGEGGYERFLEGHLSPTMKLRTAIRLQTAHPAYVWLNRLQCIGIGHADFGTSTVLYDTYALR